MNLRDALHAQALACIELGSPFTGRLLRVVAENIRPGTPVTDRLLNWPGDVSSRGASVPLRLAGALHGLVRAGAAPDLAAHYVPNHTPDDRLLWQAIHTTIAQNAPRIESWLNSAPQTNEVGRSAVLIAVGHLLTAEFNLPLVLSELGASAGLNLMWDHFALDIPGGTFGATVPSLTLRPDWRGMLPEKTAPKVIERRGTDLMPVDPRDRERLLAYIWPDQPERLARTQAAFDIASAQVDRSDAADWLEARLPASRPGAVHLVYHTVAWQYFPPDTQARAEASIISAAARATPDAPLAWFGMEADANPNGAALSLRVWPENRIFTLGRADFHGRWVDWHPKEVA